jgi:hypothetical protein
LYTGPFAASVEIVKLRDSCRMPFRGTRMSELAGTCTSTASPAATAWPAPSVKVRVRAGQSCDHEAVKRAPVAPPTDPTPSSSGPEKSGR